MNLLNRRTFMKFSGLFGLAAVLKQPLPKISLSFRGFDLLILNGKIIDGTGKPEYQGDVGIKDGIISEIGKLKHSESLNKIDASGLKVAPGFIDIHSHTDVNLILNPKAESKIRQGVTTEVTGQDGGSWAPIDTKDIEKTLTHFKEEYGEELTWRSFKEFLDNFSARKFAVNLASMVGQGTIRGIIVGPDDRPATADEMKLMENEFIKAVEEGAAGVSSGLEYTPGSFASTDEIMNLMKGVPAKGKLYATHMRNEDNRVIEAVNEAIQIAEGSGSRLNISHLKVQGKTNWDKADQVLEIIEKAKKRGLDITADCYPYIAYHTDVEALFPLWSRDGGTKPFLARLHDPANREKLQQFVEKKISNLRGDWDGVLISSIGKDEFRSYQGKTIKQLSDSLGISPYDTAVKVIIDSDDNAMMMGFGMKEESVEKILSHPLVMIASDAGAHAPYPPMNKSIAHPRAYGTFPRAISYIVREKRLCSLETMIRKMTGMPADKLHIKDRGYLRKKMKADVTIFNFNTIKDKAAFTDSHQYPEGIPYVIVNGQMVIKNGGHTGAMPGEVIRF